METISEQHKLLLKAMETAGYFYDSFGSSAGNLRFNGEYSSMNMESFKEVEQWLDGVVLDDPSISDRIEAIMHPERFAAIETAYATEDSCESDLLNNFPGMFGIYRIKNDETQNFRFAPMRELEGLGLTPDRENYELIYTGPLTIRDTQTNLHKIFNTFQRFSPERPHDFSRQDISVSDVIVLQWKGNVTAHFVDKIVNRDVEFKKLPVFTGREPAPQGIAEVPAETFNRKGRER